MSASSSNVRLTTSIAAQFIIDPAGCRVTRWHAHVDELLDVRASTDSEFIVKLHDFLYRGGSEYFYRLTLSTRPHVDYVLRRLPCRAREQS